MSGVTVATLSRAAGLARATALARPQVLLAAVVAAGLALRLSKAWSDVSTLLLEATSDDAFYYFQIARNVATGHNVTFDGETLTNGFHPLWLGLLTPVYLIVEDRELALHVGLTLGAFLGAATALLVYAIVSTLTGNRWAAVAGATVFALHPYLVLESVNGMETALAVFLFALTVWLFVRVACREAVPSRAEYALLGVSAGLMVLARTDTVLVAAPLLAYVLVRERGPTGVRSAALTGGAALLTVAPWALWSLVMFGTVVQVSGVAIPEIQRRAYLDEHGSALGTQLQRSWDVTEQELLHRLPSLYLVPEGAPRVPLLLAGAGVLAFALAAPVGEGRRRAQRQLGLLALPGAGIAAMLLFHAAIRWHVREWYFAPAALLGVLAVACLVDYAEGALRQAQRWWAAAHGERAAARWRVLAVAGLYGAVAVVALGVYSPLREDRWDLDLPHRLNMLEAARWLSDNTAVQARIGSFNAGIIGYFSERTVVNLDGVVNEDAYHARRDGRTKEYICGRALRYLADVEVAELWAGASCDAPPCRRFSPVATIGRPLPYLRGGQVDVLEIVPSTAAACADLVAGAPR